MWCDDTAMFSKMASLTQAMLLRASSNVASLIRTGTRSIFRQGAVIDTSTITKRGGPPTRKRPMLPDWNKPAVARTEAQLAEIENTNLVGLQQFLPKGNDATSDLKTGIIHHMDYTL